MSTTYLKERTKEKNKEKAMKETLSSCVPSIFISALCFFGATFGVSVYSKIDMIGSICTLLSRGAIISMIVVIFILPSLLLLFDRLIMKTTKNMKEVL
jgi:predicted RND superfamily exporter protein